MTAPNTLSVELPTRRATLHLARLVAATLKASDLVVLSGALGAGKTFFVRGLARALGLPASERVTSPTFALVQELETVPKLVHADVYRLSSAAQVADLGLLSARAEGAALIVEWGEPYIDVLGGDALCLDLNRHFEQEQRRQATFKATGPRAEEALAQLQTELPLLQAKLPTAAG